MPAVEMEASAEAKLPSLVPRCHPLAHRWCRRERGGTLSSPFKSAGRFLGLAESSVPLILLVFAKIEWTEVFPRIILELCRI